MAEKRIQKISEALFQVQPAEQRQTLLMFFYLLVGMSSFILGRTIRDTLFLSNYKSSHLPLMYIAVAVAVSLVAIIYSRFADRFRRDKFIHWVDLGMAAIILGFWVLVRSKVGDWIYPALYIFVEIMGALIVVMFWTLANEVFTTREAKRLFGIIGAGGVLANVVSGLLTGWLVKKAGIATVDLLLLTAVYLMLGALIMRSLGRNVTAIPRPQQAGRRPTSVIADMRDVLSSKHLTNIAALVAIMSIAISVVDYTFKMSARQTYHGDELTVFFSWFVGGTGVLASLMQFFVTGRLLERYGVLVALLLLPIGMGSGLAWFIPTGILGAAIVSQASNYVFRYTINDATMQLLYIPVNPSRRSRAKAFIDGMMKQWFNGLAGILLFFMTMAGVPLNRIALVPLALIVLWLVILLRVKSEYLRSLMETLRKRGLDPTAAGFNPNDGATVGLLTGMLTDKTAKPDHILHAIDMTEYAASRNWVVELSGLLPHPDERVRRRALERLGASEWGVDLREMVPCLSDADEQVRATAILAYCQILKERAVNQIRPFLKDPSPRIRAAAASGLIKYCGLDGILEAADVLKKLLENEDATERFWGANTLSQIAVSNFYRTLLRLLGDRDIEVQKEAISAAGEMKSMELIPALVYKLGYKGTASAASAALVKYGDIAVETLYKVVSNRGEKREIRYRIPRILAEIGTRRAFDNLMKCIGETDDMLLMRILSALARVRHVHPDMKVEEDRVLAHVVQEIRKSFQTAVVIRDLALDASSWNLLKEALEVYKRRHIISALKLVEVMYPQSQINVVVANLSSDVASVRANAIEAIDNMVSRKIGRLLIPLIESGAHESEEKAMKELGGIKSADRREWLLDLLRRNDGWLVTCTMNEIRINGPEAMMDEVAALVKSEDPVVRETALFCMCSKRTMLVEPMVIEKLKFDRSPMVSGFARELLRRALPEGEGAR
jgi:ATP/ADP translocase/HEAT repeat protein